MSKLRSGRITEELGTLWVAPGMGATVDELLASLQGAQHLAGWEAAAANLLRLKNERGEDWRTNLALMTGWPLQEYDMARMASAAVESKRKPVSASSFIAEFRCLEGEEDEEQVREYEKRKKLETRTAEDGSLLVKIGEDRWQKLPRGWTEDSLRKFWKSLTGDRKHKITACMKKMAGIIDDPGAFCGGLASRLGER